LFAVLFTATCDSCGVTVLGSREAGTGLLLRIDESNLPQAADEVLPPLAFDPPTAHAVNSNPAVTTVDRWRIDRRARGFMPIWFLLAYALLWGLGTA